MMARPMVGCKAAIEWVQGLPVADEDTKERVLNRMQYEFEKDTPVEPKYHKGKYGHKYDSYTCGNCGATIPEAHWKYCPNCGYAIKGEWWTIKEEGE